jgi:hypothetical protein
LEKENQPRYEKLCLKSLFFGHQLDLRELKKMIYLFFGKVTNKLSAKISLKNCWSDTSRQNFSNVDFPPRSAFLSQIYIRVNFFRVLKFAKLIEAKLKARSEASRQ